MFLTQVYLLNIFVISIEKHLFGYSSKAPKSAVNLQSNLDGSNTDGSFTIANSSSFLSPYEILPIAQENKYLRKFSYFIVKLYVVCTAS